MEDRVALEEELSRLQKEEQVTLKALWREWAGGNEGLAASSGFEGINAEIKTLDMLLSTLDPQKDAALIAEIETYLNGIADAAYNATVNLEAYGDIKNRLNKADSLVEAAKAINPANGAQDHDTLLAAYDT